MWDFAVTSYHSTGIYFFTLDSADMSALHICYDVNEVISADSNTWVW